ncbi:MAG: MBL fold metallo-hydrolase [Lachnospiraceae bacterium]|nr:MBL fold metallo-hydrolase [Lachnospiraceae bacterium]
MMPTNFYYMHLEGSQDAIVFDPADSGKELADVLQQEGLTIRAIFLTHAHFDHIFGVKAMKEATGAPVYAYEGEKGLCGSSQLNQSAMVGRPCTVEPDVWLKDGEVTELCGIRLKTLATPGHTEGSCCFYAEDEEGGHFLISGDTLFEESVGRTDLPTGSFSDLARSIREVLFGLPDDTLVFPGHMGETTIGHEKQFNYMV